MLNDLLINEAKSEQLEILGILYEEYCSGYNFLRYLALSYILTSDEYFTESFPEKFVTEYVSNGNRGENESFGFFVGKKSHGGSSFGRAEGDIVEY
ncbi:hypothetical protein [Paenibacillus sp. FSL R5-0912]|uniref:hypothetical protein n=1 Tax=Paenibacillus sp. FSL R5-0912 TaxID=1536771 RepID=UPI0004F73F7E|nr:hypothetical protein [Paenibacillus sp. FSL R5-0912]AIQ42135.1 hypothetical protein R50912_20335 [Paenibacillus sp. FSL R5-0912]